MKITASRNTLSTNGAGIAAAAQSAVRIPATVLPPAACVMTSNALAMTSRSMTKFCRGFYE